jgi:hypothetical protein
VSPPESFLCHQVLAIWTYWVIVVRSRLFGLWSSNLFPDLLFINFVFRKNCSQTSTDLPTYLSTYPHTYLPVYLWFYSPLLGLGRFFSFLIFYIVSRTPWTSDQSVAKLLPAYRTEQTQDKRTQTSMPQVGFEPTIPVFERAKNSCTNTFVLVLQDGMGTEECWWLHLFLFNPVRIFVQIVVYNYHSCPSVAIASCSVTPIFICN